jgi:hypothetical protein
MLSCRGASNHYRMVRLGMIGRLDLVEGLGRFEPVVSEFRAWRGTMMREETYLDGIDFRSTSSFSVDWSRVIFAFTSTSRDSLTG